MLSSPQQVPALSWFGAVPLVTLFSPLAVFITPGEAPCYTYAFGITCLFFPSLLQQLRFLQHQMAMAAAAAQTAQLHRHRHTGSQSKSKMKRGMPTPKFWAIFFFLFYKHKTIEWKELYFYFIFPWDVSILHCFTLISVHSLYRSTTLLFLRGDMVKCFSVHTNCRNNISTRNIFQRM